MDKPTIKNKQTIHNWERTIKHAFMAKGWLLWCHLLGEQSEQMLAGGRDLVIDLSYSSTELGIYQVRQKLDQRYWLLF